MRRILLTLILMFPLLVMAQVEKQIDMTPKVIEDVAANKKYFMFNMLQSRDIAKKYTENELNREKIAVISEKVTTLEKINKNLDESNLVLKEENRVLEQISNNKTEIIKVKDEIILKGDEIQNNQSKTIQKLDKEVKKRERNNKILIGTNIVTVIVAVVLYSL
jgi:hypothetical protein